MTRGAPIPDTVTIHVPFRVVKRGGRKEMHLPTDIGAHRHPDDALIKALARAFRWKRMLESGEFATMAELGARDGIASSYMTRMLRLTLLAPDIVDARPHDTRGQPEEPIGEVQQLEKKNLALEALHKLLNDEIRSRSKTNVVETKLFSERLEGAIARYHTNAISTVEVLQELIDLAKEVRAARRRGEDEGLSPDEIAFYDALAENESAVELMGNDSLKVIAHELLVSLKGSASVDWSHRESARARMRVLVKRILRKHGIPPDLQDAAVQTVLRQAEALSSQWAV